MKYKLYCLLICLKLQTSQTFINYNTNYYYHYYYHSLYKLPSSF